MSDQGEVLAVVSTSLGRRTLGVAALWFLACLLIYVAVFEDPAFGWRLFLLGAGLGAGWIGERLRLATGSRLELTETELRDSNGTVLTRIDNVRSMERGMFAFKPSNGFLLNLHQPAQRAWRPGLWWRFGKRVGVGGMTAGSQTKIMAEMISAMIAQRTGGAY